MKTKTEIVREFVNSGKIKEALRLMKGFQLGFTVEEKRVITIGYECMSGKEDFYKAIGKDVEKYKDEATNIANRYKISRNEKSN